MRFTFFNTENLSVHTHFMIIDKMMKKKIQIFQSFNIKCLQFKHVKTKQNKKTEKYAYTLSSARYSRYKSLQAVNKEGKFNKQLRTSIIHSTFFTSKIKIKEKLI